MQKPDISVVVTAYGRPKMVEDLIESFLAQTYWQSELVIVDDKVDDRETPILVSKYASQDSRIRFVKNKENIGFSKNFLKSLEEAHGDYLVILGDDDLLVSPDALSTYVSVFKDHPKVGYVYSNVLQFNDSYRLDFAYRHFDRDVSFDSTEDALEQIWLKSAYIPGVGLRNTRNFTELYPKEDMLFPQIELIGKILVTSGGYGIGQFLVAGRAHSDQLGFAAIQGKRIKKNEKRSIEEIPIIFKRVQQFYHKKHKVEMHLDSTFITRNFEKNHATILPTEKINAGNQQIIATMRAGYRNNHKIILNPHFVSYFLISLLLPKKALLAIKEKRKQQIVKAKYQALSQDFSNFIEGLRKYAIK